MAAVRPLNARRVGAAEPPSPRAALPAPCGRSSACRRRGRTRAARFARASPPARARPPARFRRALRARGRAPRYGPGLRRPRPYRSGHTSAVERREREAIMRQGATRPETPRDRREREALEEDLLGNPLAGQPLRQRLRNFRPDAGAQLTALGGPLAWMRRLRRIEAEVP